MDKEKSEKLKEVLNQALSTDDIQKKLEKETEIIIKKKKEKKNKKIEEENKALEEEKTKKLQEAIEELDTKIEKEVIEEANDTVKEEIKEPKKEELVIPTIRDKKKEENGSNLVLYLVSIIAILLLILTIYLYTKDDNPIQNSNVIKKETISQESLPIKEIVKEEITKAINEKTIENDEKNQEEPLLTTASTESKEKEIKIVEKPVEVIKEVIKEKIVEKPVEVIKEVIKEKVVTKVIKLEKQNFKEFYNSTKYNTLKCYDFKAGDIFPNAKCKTQLKTFLKANKDAIRFEIIPVIADEDNQIFAKMKSNLKNMEQSFQDRVKEYMFRGLGRERVLETSWQVKDILGEDVVLTPTNYYVKSKKNNKGIIIKAYH